jgi:hypothetical protein
MTRDGSGEENVRMDAQSPSSQTEPDVEGDAFPELIEFQAEQRARHRRLILSVVFGSLAFLIVGGGMVRHGLAAEKSGIFALGCIAIGLGLVGLVRAAISGLTDVDTRDRRHFETEVADLPDENDLRQGPA